MTVALRRLAEQFSPMTLAVALTAVVAASAFTVFDVARTFNDTGTRFNLIARSFAAELAEMSAEQSAEALPRTAVSFGQGVQASLRSEHGKITASTQISETGDPMQVMAIAGLLQPLMLETPAGKNGALTVQYDQVPSLYGAMQRAMGAFGLALLTIVSCLRRRAPAPIAVKGQRDHFEDLIATIPFGVACWSSEGELVVCNEHYGATLAREGAPVVNGTSYHAAVRQLSSGGFMRMISEDDKSRLMELHHEDGSCLLIDERPLVDGGFVTFVTDVTERKRTDVLLTSIREEQRLLARRYHEEKIKAEAASRSKTSFLAHLSHDIRTPLNHIIGFADLMRHQTYGPLGDARYIDYVETIKNSGERLLESFASILDLAELDSGRKTLREERFEIDEILVATTRRFSAQASRAGLVLAIGAASDAVVWADRYCLERMLSNIVENAIRFTPHGGKVTLAAFAATDGVVLEISDTGIGMTEEQLANLSQPFVLGDAAFTREHGGTGLGIAIARAIAELSGGRLAIDSSPAMGTTVAISLPLMAAREGSARAA
jgi:two-component system cell cycle sensor histidine kinase PleC